MERKLFTSESVSEGHPDKICDQISDAVLDACLKEDPDSRVACEVFITKELVIVGGEIKTKAKPNIEKIVRETLREIGYTHKDLGIGCDTCKIQNYLHEQSPDIALGVDGKKEQGAGDQGIMFGYASRETKEYMPLAIVIAHNLVKLASKLRKNGEFKYARPDMKSQVTIDYTNKKPEINTILMSVQHNPDYNEEEFKAYIKENIIEKVLKDYDVDTSNYKVLINPTGRFVIGGPAADTGLTGRKIIIDTYGGYARHGGGAFSGKDASKVDRSAAYMARFIAKNIVANNFADKCEVQLSYAIGVSEPISIHVNTFNTNKIPEEKIIKIIRNNFDLTPRGITETLELKKPIFKQTATYGHFGRNELNLPWERIIKLDTRCL